EELGLIIALAAIVAVIIAALFAVKSAYNARSSYYVIAACATAGLLVFQTMLNVCGSLDILPLTGVTFPFISNGGSSMIASWMLLAFLKAADTRQNASFAIPLPRFIKKGGKPS
ncbi:MAG: FtsW/RodA/SpoVE family cell cycle protein, partial [Clostridiales bacterium]